MTEPANDGTVASPITRVTLVAMDETASPETGILALVAVLVPVEAANPIREDLYRFLDGLENAAPRTVNLSPPPLHGSDMLRDVAWATDAVRLACFEHVVNAVNSRRLSVLRVAYYQRTVRPFTSLDPKLHGLCFSGMTRVLQPWLADSYMIPVMDGLNERAAFHFGSFVRMLDITRALPDLGEHKLSVRYTPNLLETVFVTKKYSPLIQIADVIAYLLHVRDLEREGKPVEGFKVPLLSIARSLDPELLHDQVVAMQWLTGAPAPKER